MPDDLAGLLSTAADAGRLASRAGARALWLTHLWPGSDHTQHLAAAASAYAGPITIATPHLIWEAPPARG